MSQESLENRTDSMEFITRGSLKTVDVTVGGTKVKVKTDATPSALKQVQDLVEAKFAALDTKLMRDLNLPPSAVVVALNLAEELMVEREKLKYFKRQLLDRSERLLDRVESHLNKLLES